MSFASLFAGKMLGDGYMNRTHKAPRFAFIHSLSDKAYADFCFHFFSQYLPFGQSGTQINSYFDYRTKKTYHRVFCQSRTSALLNELYPIWYQGRKVIPMEWVAKNLDAGGLAIWFQDDGHLKKSGHRIILSTESFASEEKDFLRSLLWNRFHVAANIDGQGRLDISARVEVRKFQALVEPHMHVSMSRKSIKTKWNQWRTQWQVLKRSQKGTCRTSIYLPYNLYETMRGEGYSNFLNNLLNDWMNIQWKEKLLDPGKRYCWLINREGVQKGTYLLTPRFRPDIKGRLDLLSIATGFERSKLVTMALKERTS